MDTLVFDNTVLSHFARARQLDALRLLTEGFRCVTPAEVVGELVSGVGNYPALVKAVELAWVETVEVENVNELVSFARYKGEFGGGPAKNTGEAAVLAWAVAHGGTVIVDDAVATRAARRDQIPVHGTLWLIINGHREGKLKREEAERMVDELAATDMRLPVDGAGLFAWAYEEGLLP